MNNVKLDRLSALLEGLAPVVTLDVSTEGPQQGVRHAESGSGLRLYFLTCGSAEIEVAGVSQRIEAPALLAVHGSQMLAQVQFVASDRNRLIAAHVELTGPVATLFLEEFSQPRVLSLMEEEPTLTMAVAMIEAELNSPRCGHPALLNRAGDILFIGLLRFLVAQPVTDRGGLFNGLADPRIAKALVAIHQRPAHNWNLALLAKEAGMSRTAFATKFHETMRRPPGKYLSAVRLALAQRTVDLGQGLKEAARVAGYESSAALSRALAKVRSQSVPTWR